MEISFFQALARHKMSRPHDLAIGFEDFLDKKALFTWEELSDTLVAARDEIKGWGVPVNGRIAIVSPSLRDQIIGFLAAAAAGYRPSIFSFPSLKQDKEAFLSSFYPMLEQGEVSLVITSPSHFPVVSSWLEAKETSCFVLSDSCLKGILGEGQLNFFQYSSGTTGARKGVEITETMFLKQAISYQKALDFSCEDRVASWLPLYHDMGLVACLLMPLYFGAFSYHLSPFLWLQKPSLLFEVISEYKATRVWLPNFAYTLLADRIDEQDLKNFTLSSVRSFINCSEPVKASSHRRFLDRFQPIGAKIEQLKACYAMAETTFAITQTPLHKIARIDRVDPLVFKNQHFAKPDLSENGLEFLSSGIPLETVNLRIKGGQRVVGEIEVRCPFQFSGYLANKCEGLTDDGWVKTGDLGYLVEEDLFVTGRSKDLIIHHGENIYPTDIEEVVNAVVGVKKGRAVAFGVFNERLATEDIIIAAEVFESHLESAIKEAIEKSLSIIPNDIWLCQPGTLIKSTSGKLSRSKNRELYLAHKQERTQVKAGGSLSQEENLVMEALRSALDYSGEINPLSSIADLGADSVMFPVIVAELERLFKIKIELGALLQAETVQALTACVIATHDEGQQLVCLSRHGSKPPLFILPGAMVGALEYIRLTEYITDRPIYVLQDPYLFKAQGHYKTIQEMARAHILAIQQVQPKGPWKLFGDCFGGTVAFEMAYQQYQNNREIPQLVFFESMVNTPYYRILFNLKYKMACIATHISGLKIPLLRYFSSQFPPLLRVGLFLMMNEGRKTGQRGLISALFPDVLDDINSKSDEEMAAHLLDVIKINYKVEDRLVGVSKEVAVNRALIRATKALVGLRYKPLFKFPGKITQFSRNNPEEGDFSRYDAWGLYCNQFKHFFVPLEPTLRCPDPHGANLEPINIAKYIEELRKVLDSGD